MKRNPARIVIHIVSYLFAIIWLFPIIGVLMASVRPFEEIIHGWWVFDELNLTLQNFGNAWSHKNYPLSRGMLNSLFVTIPSTILPLFVSSLAAYGFARFKFRFKEALFIAVLVLMVTPAQMIGISVYKFYLKLGLLNSYIGLILVHTGAGGIWIMFFMRNFFNGIPIELEEAAKVDGASNFIIFLKIILPVFLPALLSAGILQFVWVWNDFFYATIVISDPVKQLITQRVPLLRGTYWVDFSLLSSASAIVMLLPVIIFLVANKYFFTGVLGWGISK